MLCEKPMAVTVQRMRSDDRRVPTAPRQADDRVSPSLRRNPIWARSRSFARRRIGEPKFFNSSFSMTVREHNIRTDRELGGGTLLRHRRYCHQRRASSVPFGADGSDGASRSTAARPDSPRIDESTGAVLRFERERLASFVTQLQCRGRRGLVRIVGTNGHLRWIRPTRARRRSGLRVDRQRENHTKADRQAGSVRAGAAV